jgi:hypothetical protein
MVICPSSPELRRQRHILSRTVVPGAALFFGLGVDEKVPNRRHTNEVIGAFVTAGTKIHLHKYLDRLKQKEIYCDRDSVIFIQPDDQPALVETGDCLGAMISELKPVLHIEEFVSGGPKNYVYRTVKTATGQRNTVCKVRGITLNYSASRLVNFDVMRDIILRVVESDGIMINTEHKFKSKRARGRIDIITEPEDKMYRVSFFKRRNLDGNTSVPFGYINER